MPLVDGDPAEPSSASPLAFPEALYEPRPTLSLRHLDRERASGTSLEPRTRSRELLGQVTHLNVEMR